MKQLFTFFVACCLATAAHAQITLGIRGGFNLANLKTKETGGSYTSNTLAGIHFGGIVDFTTSVSHLHILPELLFSTEGGNYDHSKQVLSNLAIPVSAVYKGTLGPGYLYGGIGPRIGLILGAKYKEEGKSWSNKDDFNTVFLDANFKLGYELSNRVLFEMNYATGITDITQTSDKVHGKVFTLSIGYKFHKLR